MFSMLIFFIGISLIWQFTTGKLALIAFVITLVLVIAKRDNEELSNMITYAGSGLTVSIVVINIWGFSEPITWLALIFTLLCTSLAVIAHKEEGKENELNKFMENLQIEREQKRIQEDQARREAERQQEEAIRLAEEQERQEAEARRLALEQENQERMRIAEAISQADYETKHPVMTKNLAEGLTGACDLDQDYIQDLAEERGVSILGKLQAEKTLPASNDSVSLHFVKVKFPSSDNTYDYICYDETVQEGTYVYVDTKYGRKKARVVKSFNEYLQNMPLPAYVYKTAMAVDREQSESKAKRNYSKTSDWTGFCVKVSFDGSDRLYSYRCPYRTIFEGDFVRVRARGRIETAKVVETFYDDTATWSMVVGEATENQIEKWKSEYEDDDDELSWEEEEEMRRDDEEDARRRALEEEEEWREIYAEEERNRQIAAILAYQEARERSYSSSSYYDDDWSHSKNSDDSRIYDSRGFAVNGKLLEYYRNVEKTGIADTEYEQELKDGYRYCDDHEDYDDCHYGHDDDSYDSDDSYDDDSCDDRDD